MKIAYLSTFYPYRGGIAQFNAALYQELLRRYEVRPYTFLRQYPDMLFPGTSQFVQPGDNAVKLESERILDTVNPVSYYRAAMKIKKFLPDMLLTKFWMPFFGPSLGSVAKFLPENVIKVSILDNVKPHEQRMGDLKLAKYFLSKNDAFIVMSDTVRDDLLELKPDARFKQHLHPLYDHFGEKLEQKQARDIVNVPFDKKILLFFGFIRDYKGLDLLIEALAQLPEEYHLLIAGEIYGGFAKYQNLIDKYNLEERVTMHIRYIADDEVPAFFSAADVCVLPYRSATQSGITAIAFHFGVPLIATNVGSLKEMLEPHNTGYLIPNPSYEALKSGIMEFFNNSLFSEYKVNISKYKKFASWHSLADTLSELYYEIYNERVEKAKKTIKLM